MFMQKQEMECIYQQGHAFTAKEEVFQSCPHHSLTISKPQFWEEKGLSCAQASVSKNAQHHPSYKTEKWSSKQGYFKHLMACESCPSDAECIMKLEGPRLRMRYTCYRVLGSGVDSSDPAWAALLTGEGKRYRSGHEYDAFIANWLITGVLV